MGNLFLHKQRTNYFFSGNDWCFVKTKGQSCNQYFFPLLAKLLLYVKFRQIMKLGNYFMKVITVELCFGLLPISIEIFKSIKSLIIDSTPILI